MRKRTVLIVDDQEINRKILGKILSTQYTLLYAVNGVEALRQLREHAEVLAAVLLDIVMPEMDGYQVLRAIRDDKRLNKIPVIVSSQREGDEDEVKALALGAQDFIAKPYKPDIIRHRLANTIELRETAAVINTVRRDELTGLYNKGFFLHEAEALLQREEQAYDLICLDIERFKLVNDTYGTGKGDELLRFIGGLLQEFVGDQGICAHFSGDIFYMMIKRRDRYDPSLFAAFAERVNRFSISITIKIRYGIYRMDDHALPVSAMCDRAQLAVEEIKGKYDQLYAFYDDSARQRLIEEQAITNCMQLALEQGQFEVYYQPKYDLESEAIVGAEALVRWNHPQKGFLSPSIFIPLFEKNGFITKLDEFVWETACRDIRRRMENGGQPIAVSVNVSRADIYNPLLADTLLGLVRKYEIPIRYLHLEITETAYTENADQIIETVSRLRNSGFLIEMDDFGSGYSSLNMLAEMPIDVLKLDMRFIQKETGRRSGQGILSFIISLAKWLNLAVVAEGVETQDQINLLRTMDCNYVQGFYYAKPMPYTAFEELLRAAPTLEMNCKSALAEPSNKWLQLPDLHGRTLLVVDDIEGNRAVLCAMFEDQFTIAQAANGREAWEFLQQKHDQVDLVLLDLLMPEMDGFQLLEHIRCTKEMSCLPVIITSQGDAESELRALSMEADDFISKPYNMQIVQHRVRNVLANSRMMHLEQERVLQERMQEIEQKANRDELTGLCNRTALEHRVREFFEQGRQQCAFLIMDVDNFKLVNDALGHLRGDETLRQTARVLQSCFRSDDLICRMGGDEFAVFIPFRVSSEELCARLQQLCRRMQLSVEDIHLSCSIGVSVGPAFGKSYHELYNNADIALLTAKRYGKDQYRIYGGETELPSHTLFRNMDWLLDESTDAVFVCDVETYQLLYVNSVAAAIAGKSKSDCMGKCCYEALWNRSSPCEHCIDLKNMSRDFCEHEASPVDTGRSFVIKGKLVDWGGKPARIQYVQDNTEKSRMLHDLIRVSNDRKHMLDLLPGGLLRYEADGVGAFDYINENLLHMLGYTREAFTEKFQNRFAALVWREDRTRALHELRLQVAQSGIGRSSYRIERSDGSLCPVVDVSRQIVDERGKRWFYTVILADGEGQPT